MDKPKKVDGCSSMFGGCLVGAILGGVLAFLPATMYVVGKQNQDPRAGGSSPMGGVEISIIMFWAAVACGLFGAYIVWRRSQK